jgi:uncharacterized membrane protein
MLAYWFNLVLLGGTLFASWRYANRNKLLKPGTPPETAEAICRRIVLAQGLYALGALLCIPSPAWSLGFILMVQLNYAIAPRFRRETGPGQG